MLVSDLPRMDTDLLQSFEVENDRVAEIKCQREESKNSSRSLVEVNAIFLFIIKCRCIIRIV
jgi:hypothetical protein